MEPKWDGYRFLYSSCPDRVQAHTRNDHPHGGRFPYLEAVLREAFPAGAVVDGEVVALGVTADGRLAQDFDLLGPIFAAPRPHAPEACGLYFVACRSAPDRRCGSSAASVARAPGRARAGPPRAPGQRVRDADDERLK